jgi:hypothetical protein
MEWKKFSEEMPDGGDTVIVFDPINQELAVFILSKDDSGETSLSNAWAFGSLEDWSIEGFWLWTPCPIPPVQQEQGEEE